MKMPTIICLLLFLQLPEQVQEGPLLQAHAHNDYYHDRPLLDALDHGFCSVEADIFLKDSKLVVAHSRNEIDENKTLQKLYLDPLLKRCKKNGGKVYPNGPTITLLIDLKSSGLETYRALHNVLANYKSILSTYENGKFTERAVNAIISGNRPQQFMADQKVRYAMIDGRLSDLDTNKPPHLMPLISDRWTSHFKWRGKGPFTEHEKLESILKKAHQAKRKVRFWATPDVPAVWKQLQKSKVDFINTDDLPGLSKFLRSVNAKQASSDNIGVGTDVFGD